ncbi:MAG TPA: FTR1 family protein, partial [Acidocella sp.]|nr:FTR1 family protein [Acidocella sp.]
SLAALAVVVAVAVVREGSEVVLFLFGIAAGSNIGAVSLAAGGVLGLILASAVSWLLYRGLVIIPVHRLFTVTNALIALLAAGMAGQAAALLANDDLIPAFGYQIWDTSWLLTTGSIPGRALQALIGYSDRPMGVQLAAWLATLILLIALSKWAGRPQTISKQEPSNA